VQQPHYAEPDYSWIPPTSQQDWGREGVPVNEYCTLKNMDSTSTQQRSS
jgi:hypothetical protein